MKKVFGSLILILVCIYGAVFLLYNDTLAFLKAADSNDISRMEKLVKNGYNLKEDTFVGSPILNVYLSINSAENKKDKINIDVVEFMLKQGSDVNQLSYYKKLSPLNLSIHMNRLDIVELLLSYGADVTYKNNNMSPLDIAIRLHNFDLVLPLLNKGAKLSYYKDKESYEYVLNCVRDEKCKKILNDEFEK